MSDHTLSLWTGLKMIFWLIFHPREDQFYGAYQKLQDAKDDKYKGEPETLNEKGD